MLMGPDGIGIGVHYTPPPPPPPPTAADVSSAAQALHKQLGNNAPDNAAALAAAIKEIQQQNAAVTEEALARAAILLQAQYDASHHQVHNPNADPLKPAASQVIKEAESQVGLTHQFDNKTLDAAASSLSGSALATAPADEYSQATVSVGDARTAIQNGLDQGLSMQEAVNAARVQFGGLQPNDTVLDEAALTIQGDTLVSNGHAAGGNVLTDASKQLAGLHLFNGDTDKAALIALSIPLKPSSALPGDAKRADTAWATLQKDQAAHASATQIAQDTQAYHNALTTELDDAANQPAGTSPSWLTDPSQSALRWQAQQAVVAANLAPGTTGAPSSSELLTSLRATGIVDAADAARGSGTPSAAANLKAAQTLTQLLKDVPAGSALYKEVFGDARTSALQQAALADVTGAHGGNAQATLIAEGNALSGYRNTVLFPTLLHDTLASAATQHNLQAIGTPGKLTDIADLLDSVANASPELAQALFPQLQGKVVSLVGHGPEYIFGGMETPQQRDTYYGPLARIVNDAGGPQSAAAQPVVGALKSKLQDMQSLMTREQKAGQYSAENPFQPLGYLQMPQLHDPMSLYQTLINQDPNSDVGKTLEQYTGLKAQSAPVKTAPDGAGTLSTAESALDQQLRSGTVDATALQKALAAARSANPSISDKTWAEAAIAVQAQSDAAAINSGTAKPPGDLVAQASSEVGGDQVFDADTLDAATSTLQGGQVADGGLTPKVPMSDQAGQPFATQYMQSLLTEGMTMPEAIALTRAWLSGAPDSELVLTQAALTVQGQTNLPAYYKDPTGTDPIGLAATQLKAMIKADGTVLDPATIDLAVNGAPAANGQPAVVGMKQDIKPDLAALNGPKGKPGLVDKVNSTYAAWQTAQTKASQKGSSAADQQAAATALQQYHAALSAALNAAAGRAPSDGSWQSNPAYADTKWKAENQLELTALAPLIEAAQYTAKDSPEGKALQAAFEQWQTGLDALQIIGQVQYAQQLATPAGADPSAGDVAAAQTLTDETYGLKHDDPLYQQVMGDATIANLKASALASITDAAKPPMVCLANGDPSASLAGRLHAAGTQLQAYAGTALYAELLDSAAQDPALQQLFSEIHTSVFAQKKDADKLKTLADTLQGTNPDLAALLVKQMFSKGSGDHATFSPDQLVAWTKDANDMTQISRVYAEAGGAPNPDMTSLRQALEKRVVGDANFGDVSYSSRLNMQTSVSEGGAVVWGEDLGFGALKKNGNASMQLAQDMLDDDPNGQLGVEIARETGFSNLGKPAAPVTSTALADDTSFTPAAGTVITHDGHLAGLPWQDGVQTVTSYDLLLNTIGEQSNLKVDYSPSTLAEQQALAYGQFALYDPNDTVLDADGHKTTLGQLAQSLMHGEGVNLPDGIEPVTVTSLSGEWWKSRTPSSDKADASFTMLEGFAADGRTIDVGPADTTVRYGYSDWQSHSGFDKGYMLVQPHWVVDANGVVQNGNAYFVDYKPNDHWYNWDHLKTDLQMAGMVIGGIVAMIALPESAPLWMVLLSEAADAGFALTAAAGTVGALKKLSAPGGAGDWVNWLDLAANAFGGAASGLGLLARSGTMMDRLAASAPAFQDATRLTTVARDATPLEFARTEVAATLAGNRAVRTFDDTLLSRLLTRPLAASDGTVQLTADLTRALRALQGSTAFKLTGFAAMGTNAVSMAQQAYALAKAGNQATAQDWLNLFTSMGLMASGIGVERIRAGDPAMKTARVQAKNEVLPAGVRLLDSGDVEVAPFVLDHLSDTDAERVALLTERGTGIKSVTQVASILREAGLLEQHGDDGATNTGGTPVELTPDEVQVLNDNLPSGMRVTSSGTLILGEPKAGADSVVQAAALVTALQALNARQQDANRTSADGASVPTAGAQDASWLLPADLRASAVLMNAPASAADYQQMNERLTTLREFWQRATSAAAQLRQDGGTRPDTWDSTLDETSAREAWQALPAEWHLHDPASVRSLLDGPAGEPIAPGQLDSFDRMSAHAQALVDMALLDTADVQRALSGEMNPFQAYALLRVLYEQQFNGSRASNTFGISREGDLTPATYQRLLRRGDAPYWDLTDEQIAAPGARLTQYGGTSDSPFRTADGKLRVWLHYADDQDVQRMTDTFGPPTGAEPALMTSSLRTLQIETADGWQQIKFSMPERGEFGFAPGEKTLLPGKVEAAVQANDAAGAMPGLAAEPAGLSLDLGDGSRPITQLWRTMPVAERGYEPGDFTASLHVFTSPEFAATPLGVRLFGADTAGEGGNLSPQQQWLVDEVAPRLGDALLRMMTGLQAHPILHEQNVDVIVGADGHVADVVIKDLSDLKLDPRAMTAFGGETRWPQGAAAGNPDSVLARAYPASADGDSREQLGHLEQFYESFTSQLGRSSLPADQAPDNVLLDAVVNHLVAAMRQRIPADWLAARSATKAHQAVFGTASKPPSRVAGVRELLLQYAEDENANANANANAQPTRAAGSDESSPPAAQALLTMFSTWPGTMAGSAAPDGINAGSLAPVDAVGRDAGSNGQRTRGQNGQASEGASGARAPSDAKAVPAVVDQQSRGTRDQNHQPQQETPDELAQGEAKPTQSAAKPTATSPDTSRVNALSGGDANDAATPEPGLEPALAAGQKITRYDVGNAIRVIKARFGKFILPGQMPNAEQVALLEPERFVQARQQAAQEGRGSFDDNVGGFTVVDGTMEIDGRQVRVVLPCSIAPENVTASSVVIHDMLHFAQSPEFIAWSRELNARLNADPQVKANGWFNIDTHEGLTELFNVKINGGAAAPGEDNTSFANHVYESFHQGYPAILYALDGAVNELVVDRIGEDVAARAYFDADPEAKKAYEAELFDVYRNTPQALADLRAFVTDKMGLARSGGTGAANDTPGDTAGGGVQHMDGEPVGSSAQAEAEAEASSLLARVRARVAEVAYARFARWNNDPNQSGGAPDAVARAAAAAARMKNRIASRVSGLSSNSPAAPGDTPLASYEAGTDVDNLGAAFDKRGLSNFYLLDGAGRAADQLRDKSKIVLVTGFSVDLDEHGRPMPETDGPPGTAYLARVIEKLSAAREASGGKPMQVTVVTDSANLRAMRASLDALGAHNVPIELFDTPYGPAAQDGARYDSGARPAAGQLLDRLAPDAVVSIELPAHTSVDGPINMRGKSVKGFNSARDALIEVANERGVSTFGVGDGGNEAGVVQKQLSPWVQQNIPMVTLPDGTQLEFRSDVPVDRSVTSWNSNLGAQLIGLGMLQLEGRLNLAPDGAAYEAAIEACARAGAVDGVSRVRAAAVDGFTATTHAAFTDAGIVAARDPHGVFLPDRPAIVVVFDSSNGALVAHAELEAEISFKTGRAVQFVYVVDHGNAPYGQYAQELDKLADFVRLALQTGDEIPSAELIVMACNTAHGPHYRGMMDLDETGRPVINLIETTALMMLDEGGAHPALFATKTTVGTHMYRDRVDELSGGAIAVQEVAAPHWADFVNAMDHQSDDRAVRARVQADVNEIVMQLDENTTSVWLCCTHYPALEQQIRTALNNRGMNDVPIINPMTEQGAVARAAIGWDALPEGTAPLLRNPAPLVLTTSPEPALVAADARLLTGYEGVRAIGLESFGSGSDLAPAHDALAPPRLKPISRLLATQWASGGELHHGAQTHIFTPNAAEIAAASVDPSSAALIIVGAEHGAADGVAAAGLLGGGLSQAGSNLVYVVPDEQTAQSVRIAHAAAGTGRPKVEVFKPGGDPRRAAADLLERVGPVSVFAVKVYGRNADGAYHTTDGTPIDAVPLDEILLQANAREIDTVGIGDAPVYAGLHTAGQGPWYEVRPIRAEDGTAVNPGSVVTSKFPITGPTAMTASDGLLGALHAAERLDVLLTPEQFGDVISIGSRFYRDGNAASRPGDQQLDGLRGRMTRALHELLLSLRGLDTPPDPLPLDPLPEPQPDPLQGSLPVSETSEAAQAEVATSGDEAAPGEVAYARLGRWNQGSGNEEGEDTGSAAVGAPGSAAAAAVASEPDLLVPGDKWADLLDRLNGGELHANGDAYVYLVQSSQDPNRAGAPGGIKGKLIGWAIFPQGSKQGRWLGQSEPGGAPGQRIAKSPLNADKVGADLYVVMSRRPPAQVGTDGRFPAAQWTDDPTAIAWADAPAPSAAPTAGSVGAATQAAEASSASSASSVPKASPASKASPGSKASAASKASPGSKASPASKTSPASKASPSSKASTTGKPMRWARIGTTFGGVFGVAAGSIDLAGHLALPAATASLCFIYRGSVVALRTRLGTLISRHVAGAAGADPEPHLDWIQHWLVQRGAAWGINRSVRRDYEAALTTLRATPGDAQALAVLAGAPGKLYMPRTVLGNVNDVLQAATLAANVSINGTYVLEKGVSHGVAPMLVNLGFGLSNTVLTTKNLAGRLAGLLRTSALGVTVRVQDLAQATVMNGYTLATIPWIVSDAEVLTPLGLVKGGLDVVFGVGSGVQGYNDTRKITSGGTARPIRIGRVHPLMFLAAGAIARFVLQAFTLPPGPAVQAQGNGNGNGAPHQKPPGNGQPSQGSGPGPGNQGTSGNHGQNGNQGNKGNHGQSPGKTGKPTEVSVKHGDSLWGISETHLKEILSASEIAELAPQGQDAETAAALHQLLQLNPKFDEHPDLIFKGETVVLNNGS